MENKINQFIESLKEEVKDWVLVIHEQLMKAECICEVKEAKSGFVVSYHLKGSKKTLATFVVRKSGMKIRVFPEHLLQYEEILEEFPKKMKAEIERASVCKRLIDPNDCNPKCPMGYTFTLEEKKFQKCRYMAFLLSLNKESLPFIQQLLASELARI